MNEANVTAWIIELSRCVKIPIEAELFTYLSSLEDNMRVLRKERRNYPMSTSEYRNFTIRNDLLIKAIELIMKDKTKRMAYLSPILAFLNNRKQTDYSTIVHAINMQKGTALFSDNE